ncbi:hypothetical protein, partial [Escherichia coli]|uniref:hypothetical protein n=1 Tax=Escherichia coli TaxID=562 RepID=UPI003C71AE34
PTEKLLSGRQELNQVVKSNSFTSEFIVVHLHQERFTCEVIDSVCSASESQIVRLVKPIPKSSDSQQLNSRVPQL